MGSAMRGARSTVQPMKERLRRTGVTAGTAKRFQVLRTEAASAVSAMKAM